MNFFLKKLAARPALRVPAMDLFDMECMGDRWLETHQVTLQWEEEQV